MVFGKPLCFGLFPLAGVWAFTGFAQMSVAAWRMLFGAVVLGGIAWFRIPIELVPPITGEELYVYHGNDGTSLPWNDTAQLDYLRPETREAVMQEILGVARRFSVIRFDAAMTLDWWFPILWLTAILSTALAVTNLLPLPALDGGVGVVLRQNVGRAGEDAGRLVESNHGGNEL